MSRRKTIKVDDVVQMANQMLAKSNDDLTEARRGVIHLLERILHETDNYRGFHYRDGYPCADETRRGYYWKGD